MKHLPFLTCMSVAMFLLMNCSSGKSFPVAADLKNTHEVSKPTVSRPIIGFDGTSATGLMGAYSLNLSNNKNDAELTSLRTSNLGESYTVAGDPFFTSLPCVDCLKIKSIGLDPDENIILKFSIKHPYQKGNPSLPPSGKNRLDLDIFDVAMIVAPQNSTPNHYTQIGIDIYTDLVMNADGYTPEMGNVLLDDSVLPYVICYEDSSNNRFEMGKNEQEFDVMFTGSEHAFILYLTMAYGTSAVFEDRLVPEYYIPEFNRKQAWKVDVIPPPLNQTWNAIDTTTERIVSINVYDWNHGVDIAPVFPDPLNKDQIRLLSDITSVFVEIPGMTNTLVEATSTDTETNGWDDPITYTAAIANENGLPGGEYTGLVKVLDSRQPGTGMDYDTLINTPDGKNLEWYLVPEFATYQTFTAIIQSSICGPVTGEIISPACPVEDVCTGSTVDFTVIASSDNGGDPIILYEADWDYDGSAFDVDASSADGIFTDAGPFINQNCGGSNNPVDITVAFRATDSCIPPNTTVFATCLLTIICDTLPWLRTWGSIQTDYGLSVDVDNLGNIYVGGGYCETVDFDPGPGVVEHTSIHSVDCYLSKFDRCGNFIWVRV